MCVRRDSSNNLPQLKKESLWALSNIAAGSRVQIQALLDSDALGTVCSIADNGAERFACRKEAFWVIANLCAGGSPEQVSQGKATGTTQRNLV